MKGFDRVTFVASIDDSTYDFNKHIKVNYSIFTDFCFWYTMSALRGSTITLYSSIGHVLFSRLTKSTWFRSFSHPGNCPSHYFSLLTWSTSPNNCAVNFSTAVVIYYCTRADVCLCIMSLLGCMFRDCTNCIFPSKHCMFSYLKVHLFHGFGSHTLRICRVAVIIYQYTSHSMKSHVDIC